MIIKEELTYGLYGQIFLWILEVLPHLDKNNIRPKWDITSPYYGDIFGKYIIPNYIPEELDELVSLSDIKHSYAVHFGDDFGLANKLWNKFFKFTPHLIDKVEQYIKGLNMNTTIGLHYRGTDKINTEGGYIDTSIFIRVLDDYLSLNKIDNIIIFTDEKKSLIELKTYYQKKYKIIYSEELYNSDNEDILFSNNIKNNVDKDKHYLSSLVDMIVLSKCKSVIKTSSQLSAWPKILNNDIEIYRVSSFIHDWFPDSRIPLYKSINDDINLLLEDIYEKEHKKNI